MTRRTVTVVDYGVGNLLSIRRALETAGAGTVMATTPEQVSAADLLLLPGVGAFAHCAGNLADAGLAEPVAAFAASGKPFLGICVGMQLLFDRSLEFGETKGLGLIPGTVEQIPTEDEGGRRKVPHIGWAPLTPGDGGDWSDTPLAPLTPGDSWAYFVHSFSGRPSDPATLLAEADYRGFPVCAAVRRDNVCGVQFHPEKSGPVGLAVLRQFLA